MISRQPLLGWGLFLSNERLQLEITKNRTKHDLCKFCFGTRIVNIWNSLPSYMVSAETVNCFKTRLDRFWHNQDIIIFVLKFTEPEAEVKLQ